MWFADRARDAIADFWRVYRGHLEANLASARALADRGGALGTTSDDRARGAVERMDRAVAGDWAPFEAHLEELGAGYAGAGLEFAAWHDVTQTFFESLAPELVRAFATEPPRLTAALLVLSDYMRQSLSIIAMSYTRTRDALRAAIEERHVRVIEASLDPVIAMDAVGIVTSFNLAAEKTFGYSRMEAIGQPLAKLVIPPELRAHFTSNLATYLARGPDVLTHRATVNAVRADGSQFPAELALASYLAPDGRREITAFLRDLTEQHRAETSVALWQQFLDQAHVGVAVSDPTSRLIVQANPAYARLVGYSVDELVRFPTEQLVDPSVRHSVAGFSRELDERGFGTFELLLRRKDGSAVPVLASSSTIRMESGSQLRISTVVDYTKHRDLERSRARAARHVEVVSLTAEELSAASGDLDTLMQLATTRIGGLVDCTCSVDLFDPRIERAVLGPELGMAPRTLVVSLRSRGAPIGVLRCTRSDDQPAFLVEDRQLAQDLADRAALAIENALLVASLEARVAERTEVLRSTVRQLEVVHEELQQTAAELANASGRKSEFLAGLSHELRTPLNAIIGFSEIMVDGLVPTGSAESIEFLGDILKSGRHLLQLVNTLLDLAKIEAGKLEFVAAPCRLSALIDEVLAVLRSSILKRHLVVRIEVMADADDVVLDPARLRQILYNYASNAIKFSRDGGAIVVRTSAEPRGGVRIEVEDSGPGLTTLELGQLFVDFEQTTTGKLGDGTGLGLALTKRLVEAQGGTVGARSVLGQGSVFWVTLPAAVPRSQAR